MKIIKCIVRIGCIWVAMNFYAQTVRLTKDMLEAIHIHVSMNGKDTGKLTKDLPMTAADGFTDNVIISVELENCSTLISTLSKLLPNTDEPFREFIGEVLQIHESNSTVQVFYVHFTKRRDNAHTRNKHTIYHFSPMVYKVDRLKKRNLNWMVSHSGSKDE